MKRLDEIKIGWQTYKFCYKNELIDKDGDPCFSHYHSRGEIEITDEYEDKGIQKFTMLKEVIHAVEHKSGQCDDISRRLMEANGLLELFRVNPAFVDFLINPEDNEKPESIEIGWQTYLFNYEDNLLNSDGDKVFGIFHPYGVIEIWSDCLNLGRQKVAMLHECIHGIEEISGQEAEEGRCKMLSHNLLQIFRENPNFISYLLSDD